MCRNAPVLFDGDSNQVQAVASLCFRKFVDQSRAKGTRRDEIDRVHSWSRPRSFSDTANFEQGQVIMVAMIDGYYDPLAFTK